MSSTLRPYSTSAAPRLMVDVVLPTPPFWLHIAMTCAGPCWVSGRGSGSGPCRAFAGSCCREAAAPISGSVSCGRATAEAASARIAMGSLASTYVPDPGAPGAVSRPARSGTHEVTEGVDPSQGGTPTRRVTWQTLLTVGRSRAQIGGDLCRETVADVSASRARMAGGVDLAQPVDGDQRVDLRGRHGGVPQQLLHHPHVGPAVEQVG